MQDIRIRQVINGFIVYDSPMERHVAVEGEYVFNTMTQLFEHLEKCFSPAKEVNLGKDS